LTSKRLVAHFNAVISDYVVVYKEPHAYHKDLKIILQSRSRIIPKTTKNRFEVGNKVGKEQIRVAKKDLQFLVNPYEH